MKEYDSNIADDLTYIPGSKEDVILKFKGHEVVAIFLPHEGEKKEITIPLSKLLPLLRTMKADEG